MDNFDEMDKYLKGHILLKPLKKKKKPDSLNRFVPSKETELLIKNILHKEKPWPRCLHW